MVIIPKIPLCTYKTLVKDNFIFYDLGMYEKMKDDDLFEYGLV